MNKYFGHVGTESAHYESQVITAVSADDALDFLRALVPRGVGFNVMRLYQVEQNTNLAVEVWNREKGWL